MEILYHLEAIQRDVLNDADRVTIRSIKIADYFENKCHPFHKHFNQYEFIWASEGVCRELRVPVYAHLFPSFCAALRSICYGFPWWYRAFHFLRELQFINFCRARTCHCYHLLNVGPILAEVLCALRCAIDSKKWGLYHWRGLRQ